MTSDAHSSCHAEADDAAPIELLVERLRRLCRRQMLSERLDHTLQATALANEVFLRLCDLDPASALRPTVSTRWFLGNAVLAIRQVVVDHARASLAKKRGGGWVRRDGAEVETEVRSRDAAPEARSDGAEAILVAHRLLEELRLVSPLQSSIAHLRFFGGLGFEQIGFILGMEESAVRREWKFAAAWLGARPMAVAWRD